MVPPAETDDNKSRRNLQVDNRERAVVVVLSVINPEAGDSLDGPCGYLERIVGIETSE